MTDQSTPLLQIDDLSVGGAARDELWIAAGTDVLRLRDGAPVDSGDLLERGLARTMPDGTVVLSPAAFRRCHRRSRFCRDCRFPHVLCPVGRVRTGHHPRLRRGLREQFLVAPTAR